jgi:hypothetical protein
MTDTRSTIGDWRALSITGDGDAAGRGSIPLAPMTIGDLLDAPFTLLRRHLRAMVLLVAVAVVPAQIIGSYLQRAMFSEGLGSLMADPEGFMFSMQADQGSAAAGWLVTGLNTLLLLPLAVGLVSRLVVSSVLGEEVDVGDVLRATGRRLPALLGAWVLALLLLVLPIALVVGLLALGGAAVVVGSIMFLPAAIVTVAIGALVAAAPTAAVVESVGPVQALRRSFRLVRPRFWGVVGALVLTGIVASLVQSAVGGLLALLAFGIEFDGSWILLAVGSIVSQLLVTPYMITVAALIYVDACVRREALDLRILAGG